MPRKSDVTATEALLEEKSLDQQLEEWSAQEPCPECGGRPGRHPVSGQHLRIHLPNGVWAEGHTYNCLKRPQ